MVYLVGFVLLLIAVWCIQDVVLKLIMLSSGVQCYAQIEEFKEYRTRSASASGPDKIRYRAVIKYVDQSGREHRAVAPRLYEKWESECLVGRDVLISYLPRNPEKFIMDKKELVRPVVSLVLVVVIPLLYLAANYYITWRYINSLF